VIVLAFAGTFIGFGAGVETADDVVDGVGAAFALSQSSFGSAFFTKSSAWALLTMFLEIWDASTIQTNPSNQSVATQD